MGYKEYYSNGMERISISEDGKLRKYNREGRIELEVDGMFDSQTGKFTFDSDMILYYRGTRDQDRSRDRTTGVLHRSDQGALQSEVP